MTRRVVALLQGQPCRSWMAPVAALAAITPLAALAGMARQMVFQPGARVVVVSYAKTEVTLPRPPGTPSSTTIVVAGELRNAGSAAAGPARVVVTAVDADGNELASTAGYPVRWRLDPGEVARFSVPMAQDGRVSDYQLRVEEAQPAGWPATWQWLERRAIELLQAAADRLEGLQRRLH